jgi:hypothetical protein
VNGLTFVGWQEPIGCGGVAVMPNDVVVADGDGAVVIPAALLDDVVAAAVEQERLEGWIMREVDAGVPLPGLYPANDATRARYEAWTRGEAETERAARRSSARGCRAVRGIQYQSTAAAANASPPVHQMPVASETSAVAAESSAGPAVDADVGHQPPQAKEVGAAGDGRKVGAERHDHPRADAVAEADHERHHSSVSAPWVNGISIIARPMISIDGTATQARPFLSITLPAG